MVYAFCKHSNERPTWHVLEHAVMKNFDGLDGIKPLEIFQKHFRSVKTQIETIVSKTEEIFNFCSTSSLFKIVVTKNFK